jgi:cyclase
MLRSRIIPCLLINNGRLVKTANFTQPTYVGDPLNAARIFNEKEADELLLLDVGATVTGAEPDYRLIECIARECRMPLCYGGGITKCEQAIKIIGMGVEKIAIGAAAMADSNIVKEVSSRVGSQSVAVVIDAKKVRGEEAYQVWTHSGTVNRHKDPVVMAKEVARLGAGEIVINSIDRDGCMCGYDEELIAAVYRSVTIQVTALGGAGTIQDIKSLIDRFGVIGAGAGSLFVFKGKYKAVLINYPGPSEKRRLCGVAC